jgi:hypothetical protein
MSRASFGPSTAAAGALLRVVGKPWQRGPASELEVGENEGYSHPLKNWAETGLNCTIDNRMAGRQE